MGKKKNNGGKSLRSLVQSADRYTTDLEDGRTPELVDEVDPRSTSALDDELIE